MEWLRLQPGSIATLSMVILSGVMAGYLLLQPAKRRVTWMLAGYLASFTGFVVCIFVSLSTVESWLLYFAIGEYFFLFLALASLIQFAYHFLGNPYEREARIVFVLSVVLLLAGTAYSVHSLVTRGIDHTVPTYLFDRVSIVGLIWVILIHLRKAVHFNTPDGRRLSKENNADPTTISRRVRPHVRLAMINAPLLALAGFAGLRNAGHISQAWLTFIVEAVLLLYLFLFVLTFLNADPFPSSFLEKLVGLLLVVVFATSGLIALLMHPIDELIDESGVSLPANRVLYWEYDQQATYLVREAPYPSALSETTQSIELTVPDDGQLRIDLGFLFPFGGAAWDHVFVSENGIVSFGSPMLRAHPFHRSNALFYQQYYDGAPKIAPFFYNFELNPPGRIYYERDEASFSITWAGIAIDDLDTEGNTFRLTLEETGDFAFYYETMPLSPERGRWGGLRGFFVSGNPADCQPIASGSNQRQMAFSSSGCAIEDYLVRFREQIHPRFARFAGMLLAIALFVLFVIPRFYKALLVSRLHDVLDGVKQVNLGKRDVFVSPSVRDEIGELADNFNQMTASIALAEKDLRTYADVLEDRVAERTSELERRTRQLEENNRTIEAQAAQLKELDQVKSRFFENISHEFRTPLTLIIDPLKNISDDLSASRHLTSAHSEQLDSMYRNALRLKRLINQLLELSKIDAAQTELRVIEDDLVGFLRSRTSMFASLAEQHGIRLEFESSHARQIVYFDPEKVETILYNLLSNAFKFTPAQGHVLVSVQDEDDAVCVTVRDSGIGIPAAEQPHIFERFRQVDSPTARAHEGTGIGLALAKEYAEAMAGSLSVDSRPGFGSAFSMRLKKGSLHVNDYQIASKDRLWSESSASSYDIQPLAFADSPQASPSLDDAPIPQFTVLAVDDNADMRRHLRHTLSPHYAVDTASNGREALERARENVPDLIVSDVMMPDMDGFALCREIKTDSLLNHIPVILLTARASLNSKLEGLEEGADDYLTKPFHREELLARMANLISLRALLQIKYSKHFLMNPSAVDELPETERFLLQVKNVVEEHMADQHFNVQVLAERMGLSQRQLLRKFRNAYNTSPSDYIRLMRIQRGAQLLERQTGTVSEIAYRVGFASASYFTKAFSSVFDLTPTEYIKHIGSTSSKEA